MTGDFRSTLMERASTTRMLCRPPDYSRHFDGNWPATGSLCPNSSQTWSSPFRPAVWEATDCESLW